MHFKNSVKSTNLKVLLKAVKEVKSSFFQGSCQLPPFTGNLAKKIFNISPIPQWTKFLDRIVMRSAPTSNCLLRWDIPPHKNVICDQLNSWVIRKMLDFAAQRLNLFCGTRCLLHGLPLHAPLPLKRFLECPLTARLPASRFGLYLVFWPVRFISALRSHALSADDFWMQNADTLT